MKPKTPVAIFAYARPDHLRRTLTSLMSCEGVEETPTMVFIDGPCTPDMAVAVSRVHQVTLQTLGSPARHVSGRIITRIPFEEASQYAQG